MKLIEKDNKKGITLIALVITIIVLLILAGVSISMLTGDNSLLGNAQKTGPANKIGAAKDEIGLAYNTAMQEYYQDRYTTGNINDTVTFASKFDTAMSSFTATNADQNNAKNHGCKVEYNESDGTITITNGGYKVIGHVDTTDGSAGISWGEMDETNGEITTNGEIVTASDIIGNETKYYGKEVKNYTTASGTYTFRIFYVDQDNTFGDGANTVYLKADPCDDRTLPITTTYDSMSDKGKMILEKQNSQWATARLKSAWRGNERATAWLCEPNNFTKTYITTGELSRKVNYVIGAPGVEMYVKSYNQTHPNGYTNESAETYKDLKATYTSGDYGYKYAFGTESASNYTADNSIDNSGSEPMYGKPNTSMWLASPSANLDSDVCYVSGNYADLYARYYDSTNSLVPLVSLSSDVQLQI